MAQRRKADVPWQAFETVAVGHAAILDLAEATGLSTYDASYLWLSRTLGIELVTLDRKLAAVAR